MKVYCCNFFCVFFSKKKENTLDIHSKTRYNINNVMKRFIFRVSRFPPAISEREKKGRGMKRFISGADVTETRKR